MQNEQQDADAGREKTNIEKCSAEAVYRLARVLGLSMDELYTQLHSAETRVAFETFKSNICHAVKEKGDLDFIIDTLQADDVQKYWDRHWYPEAYYTLAMLDYLSRENKLPLCTNYENIRRTSLKKTIYPRDIELAARLDTLIQDGGQVGAGRINGGGESGRASAEDEATDAFHGYRTSSVE